MKQMIETMKCKKQLWEKRKKKYERVDNFTHTKLDWTALQKLNKRHMPPDTFIKSKCSHEMRPRIDGEERSDPRHLKKEKDRKSGRRRRKRRKQKEE
ncbi:unnamed protein product [Brugia pahangi]|uniref:Uncharacterized protein n=1 Tax=Brugia pahangi TaxID=6280 RepID=A0A0N4TNJ9_BRUPA|nr:unnamed protein product [Brugia pahangi]